MRASTLPQIRVDEAFRASVESVLHEGETLTAFIEATMRRAVEHRIVEREFSQRGERAWENFKRTGVAYTVEVMDARLKAITDKHRTRVEKACGSKS